jgi:hypothetical protein
VTRRHLHSPLPDRVLCRMHLWPAVALILVGALVYDGAGYAVVGDRNAGPTTAVLRWLLQWGGGMRTHGVLLLVLAGWLLYGLGRRHVNIEPLRWALVASVAYSAMIVLSVFASWVLYGAPWESGGAAWGGPSKWGTYGALFSALALTLNHQGGRSAP